MDERGVSNKVKEKTDRESVQDIICRQRKRFCETETIKMFINESIAYLHIWFTSQFDSL